MLLLLNSCQDNKDENQVPVLENKSRIECVTHSPICNGQDGLRFYRSSPLIESKPGGGIGVTDVWTSLVVCCEVFPQLMDSLTLYKHILDSAILVGTPFQRTDSIGHIQIHVGFSLLDGWNGTRWDRFSFGDANFDWPVPPGEFFEEHKRELEAAYARCCL